MRVLHQAGHNSIWNINSYEEEACGDGIIFSPVHYPKEKIVELRPATKSASLFDPQFYVPDSQKTKLQSYEFFPEVITGGFSTADFEALAHKAAALCLDFQLKQGFESIIIPARHHTELVSDYVAKQKAFSVEPFLAEIERRKIKQNIYLTLPVTSAMTIDKEYRQGLLDWVTSYPEISGVYFLNEIAEPTKQICNYHKLQGHIDFVRDMQLAGLEIIVGYCNTESILLSLLSPHAVAVGAYENTRGFSIGKFLEEDSEKRGPAPRIYFPKLLNWIRYDTALEIKEDHPDVWKMIYTPTEYSEQVFATGQPRPHFSQPGPYKHHFLLICKQLKALGTASLPERIAKIKAMITEAKSLYEIIEANGVMYFDRNCSGEHLPVWNRAVNRLESIL